MSSSSLHLFMSTYKFMLISFFNKQLTTKIAILYKKENSDYNYLNH